MSGYVHHALIGILGVVALASCQARPVPPPSARAGSDTDAVARATEIEIPPSLRGLPVGPLDAHGEPSVVPCATCHELPDAGSPLPGSARGIEGPHRGLRVEHGDIACAACHHPTNRSQLRLADGRAIALTEAIRLCSPCHDPHSPNFGSFMPMPGPRDRFLPVEGHQHD